MRLQRGVRVLCYDHDDVKRLAPLLLQRLLNVRADTLFYRRAVRSLAKADACFAAVDATTHTTIALVAVRNNAVYMEQCMSVHTTAMADAVHRAVRLVIGELDKWVYENGLRVKRPALYHGLFTPNLYRECSNFVTC